MNRATSGLVAVVIVVGAAVAGCGQTSASGTGGAAQAPGKSLCADQATVSQVRVTHIPSVTQLDPGKPGTNRVFTITIASPARARVLARAVCALPDVRHGTRCAMNLDGAYQLTFSVTHVHLPVVVIHAIGCQQVTGAGQARLAASPGFWAAFSRATGIQAPAHGR